MITEMTNTTFAIWSRPLKCRTGGTTWSAALQRRRFCQAKPSLPIRLLPLLLGRIYWLLPAEFWKCPWIEVLQTLFQCLIVLAVKRDLIFSDVCLQFHLQQLWEFIVLFLSSGFSFLIKLFPLLFLCLERPAGLKITGLKPHRIRQNYWGRAIGLQAGGYIKAVATAVWKEEL